MQEDMNPGPQQPQQYTPEEVQNLKEIFDLFDKESNGQITIKDLEAIMQSLQRDPEEAKDLLRQIRVEEYQAQMQAEGNNDNAEPEPASLEFINFDEFIKMMQQIENRMAKDDPHNLNR